MDKSDEDLAAAARRGDDAAFAQLVERHLAGVYSFVVRYVGQPREAEDITQDAFTKVWSNLKKYDPAVARFKTWLMRIARNSAVDFLRKKKAVPMSSFETDEGNAVADSLADEGALPEELLARAQDAQTVNDAVASLSPAYREVLVLHYTSELTFEEIGAMLNTSVNTVKSRHRRALITLRRLLAADAPERQR